MYILVLGDNTDPTEETGDCDIRLVYPGRKDRGTKGFS